MAEGPTWVALLSNAIVGTASVVEKGEGGLYVRGMAVLPSARGRGVGELLLREIEGFALRNGCTRLVLSTTPFLNGAIRLYERFGFERTLDGPNDLFGTPLFTMAKALNGETDSQEVNRKEYPCRRTTDTPPACA
jgi:predicted N-acetyltransferase YhbS